jgi:hypothetical protein
MNKQLQEYFDNKYENITNVLLYKKLHIPIYKYNIYNNFYCIQIKTYFPNKGSLLERYMYNINDRDKIIKSLKLYDLKTTKLLYKWKKLEKQLNVF